jgi:serine phosphatase RsbU (regulator of sigma subunit)
MVGSLLDLIRLGEKPFIEVFGWTIFTGIMAVFYLICALRAPRLLILAVAFHFLISHPVGSLMRYLNAGRPAPTSEVGVQVAAIGSLLLRGLACVFFLLFVYAEGRTSIVLQTKLSLAHGIQHTLVPRIAFKSATWEIYGVSLPSDQVGGDLVDLLQEDNGSALAYVADISWHGLQAGILMGMFKTAARTCIVERPTLPEFLRRINRVLPEVKEPEMYATCAAVRMNHVSDTSGCMLEIANAGNPAILFLSAKRKEIRRFCASAPVLGLLPSADFSSERVQAGANDLLLITADGILEVMDGRGREFGIERVEEMLRNNCENALPKIAEVILAEAGSWGKNMDDQTLLLVKILG